jgi:hypothetical protein
LEKSGSIDYEFKAGKAGRKTFSTNSAAFPSFATATVLETGHSPRPAHEERSGSTVTPKKLNQAKMKKFLSGPQHC